MSSVHARELADTLQEQRIRGGSRKRPCRLCGEPTTSYLGICLRHEPTYERVASACCEETGLPPAEFQTHIDSVTRTAHDARGKLPKPHTHDRHQPHDLGRTSAAGGKEVSS